MSVGGAGVKSGKRGITLVELMISIILIAIIAIISTEFLAQYLNLADYPAAMLQVANSARAEMEGLYMNNAGFGFFGPIVSGSVTWSGLLSRSPSEYTIVQVTAKQN